MRERRSGCGSARPSDTVGRKRPTRPHKTPLSLSAEQRRMRKRHGTASAFLHVASSDLSRLERSCWRSRETKLSWHVCWAPYVVIVCRAVAMVTITCRGVVKGRERAPFAEKRAEGRSFRPL